MYRISGRRLFYTSVMHLEKASHLARYYVGRNAPYRNNRVIQDGADRVMQRLQFLPGNFSDHRERRYAGVPEYLIGVGVAYSFYYILVNQKCFYVDTGFLRRNAGM